MPLPTQTLAAIQAAGAAIFAADAELKKSVQEYADQVKAAMSGNPFDLGNDTLFEDWKTVARLSRAVAQVEAEFQKVYSAAADLSAGSRSKVLAMPALHAPRAAANGDLAMVQEIDATVAVIRKAPRKAKKPAPRKSAVRKPLGGNTAKVLARLLEILNPTDFVKINRSAVAAELGMPKGSIGASIAKLIERGNISEGVSGSLKLTAAQSHA